MTSVSVLVPVGWLGGPDMQQARGRAWTYVRSWYATHHPEWEIVEGRQSREQRSAGWVKGEALRDAASRATGAVLVVADADVFTAPEHLEWAVSEALDGRWAVPHRIVHRLTPDETERVYAGHQPRRGAVTVSPYEGAAGGGLAVLTREMWDTVGGIDTGFVGWGREDHSFGWALNATIGFASKGRGLLWHLWHPGGEGGRKPTDANAELGARYKHAKKNPLAMAELIAERRASGHLAPAHLHRDRDLANAHHHD